MENDGPEIVETGKYALWDTVVGVLGVMLVVFLMITMGIRSQDAEVRARCREHLLALSHAQQHHLVAHGKYTDDLRRLVPFLDDDHAKMSMLCPITGEPFRVAVQGTRYIVLAPYTGFSVHTGDTSW